MKLRPPFHFVPFRPKIYYFPPLRDDCATRARPHNASLRCACCASLRPFGCAFGHPLVAQCPYEGETLFQTEDLRPKDHRIVLSALQESRHTRDLMSTRQIVVKGGIDNEVLLTFSTVALGPSLSRNCPAVLYNLGTSSTICNVCTGVFVKLFRNC